MTAVVDTSVLIDVLRGSEPARDVVAAEMAVERLHSSEICRLEVLFSMRGNETERTLGLLATVVWHPVDRAVAERAGELGRQFLPAHRGIDSTDLAIAATASLLSARLLTRNVKHFPMIDGLVAPY